MITKKRKFINIMMTGCSLAALFMAFSINTCAAKPDVTFKKTKISFDPGWEYAKNSKINSGKATLYQLEGADAKHITVCINAGHGTQGGASVKTLCHPDGSPKVTSGSTAAGETEATAVSGGTTMKDGTPEAKATLEAAKMIKKRLLKNGYDVLMIREKDDVQLDNIARTLIANNCADCHIAIHYDSTTGNPGAFFCSVPDIASYREMEPVKSHWKSHNKLGKSLIKGLRSEGIPIMGDGKLPMDLTQTSYSTVPSVDLEVGNTTSDRSKATLKKIAKGVVKGLDKFFGKYSQGK